jgi:hypothetical protein
MLWPLAVDHLCPKHEIPLEPFEPEADSTSRIAKTPRWTTVAVYPSPTQAAAPRLRLEAEGIPTFLDGERVGQLEILTVAGSGVKLQVPQEFDADARILLAQSWNPLHTLSAELEDASDPDAFESLAPAPGTKRRSVMRLAIWIVLLAPLLPLLLHLIASLRSIQ